MTKAWLEGLSGEWAGKRISLSENTLLGRSRECNVRISDPRVSRRHARICWAQGRYYLQDQGSTHGTLVNGQPVAATVLQDGDVISIGGVTFRFREIREQAASSLAVAPRSSSGAPTSVKEPAFAQDGVVSRQVSSASPAPNVVSHTSLEQAAQRAVAQSKSYVGAAFLTLVLYYIGFYILGLILNVVYLSEANRIQRTTGVSPSGKGCLTTLLFFHFWLPLILCVVLVLVGGVTFTEIFSWFRDLLQSLGI